MQNMLLEPVNRAVAAMVTGEVEVEMVEMADTSVYTESDRDGTHARVDQLCNSMSLPTRQSRCTH